MTDCRPTPGLEVRTSAIHGQGVFATRRFAAGDVIACYEGRRVSHQEAQAGLWDHRLTYLFALSDGAMIDGAEGGNATRHINHACTPNCVACEIEDETGPLRVGIEALVDIAVGDELLLDYQLSASEGDPADYACRCASTACRGTMLGTRVAPQPAS
jgi:uncharacterized protein